MSSLDVLTGFPLLEICGERFCSRKGHFRFVNKSALILPGNADITLCACALKSVHENKWFREQNKNQPQAAILRYL